MYCKSKRSMYTKASGLHSSRTFFRRLIFDRSLNGSQPTWTHIHLWLLFEKFGPNSSGHLPPPLPPHTLGTNKPFWGRDRLKNLTEHICNGTRHQQSERNLSIYRDSPTCSPNLTNFGIQTAENGWRVLVNPLHFCIRRTKSLAGSRWALLRFLLVTKIN